jgi:hypothetical protein
MYCRSYAILLAFVCCLGSVVRGQDSVSTWAVTGASVIPATAIGAALYQNYETFWKHEKQTVAFHFSNDPPYALHNDKFGHAFYTGFATSLAKEAYILAGMDRKTAVWISASAAFLAQTLVEVEDGVRDAGPHTGFSPGDEIANVLGASLEIGKEYVPYLRNFDFKLGFYPSDSYYEDAYESILDDNESRYYWMSYNLSDAIEADWYPKWLNVGIGHSVKDISQPWQPRFTEVFVGFDLNLRGLPIEGKAWTVIAEILSHFRIPFPALQIVPVIKWHWLQP